MVDGIEPYFQVIADSLDEAISEPWHVAWMSAVFYSDAIFFEAGYLPYGGPPSNTIGTDRRAESAFVEIREKFKQAGKMPWGRAQFEIQSNGDFNMNWDYDNCDESGFAIRGGG